MFGRLVYILHLFFSLLIIGLSSNGWVWNYNEWEEIN